MNKQTALLLIDVQKGFDQPDYWGERNNPQAEANIARLLAFWRNEARPIFHVQHLSTTPNSPLRPGQSGCDFKAEAIPQRDELVFQKTVNSAFIGTDLERTLRAQKIEALVVVGLTTPHCISTSVRMAANLGFRVSLVADATAAFALEGFNGKMVSAEAIHNHALHHLHTEFAHITHTAALLLS